jgi:hypothetical protein
MEIVLEVRFSLLYISAESPVVFSQYNSLPHADDVETA